MFDQLDPATRLVLANAIYLNADWQTPFAKNPTTNTTFTHADGTTVAVPMMHVDRPFALTIVHQPTGAPLFIGHVADPLPG